MIPAGWVPVLALALVSAGSPLPPDVKPWPIGAGPGFRVDAAPAVVEAGTKVGSLSCTRAGTRRFGVHLEIFVRRQVLIVPQGIGVAQPSRRHFGRVVPGRCTYPLRTLDPTGVIEVRGRRTLGDFFAVWGQQLGRRRVAGFSTRTDVLAFVAGRRWRGALADIPLVQHAQIVLEVGGYVRPHPRYLFPKGL
jgi:hypothetical protein